MKGYTMSRKKRRESGAPMPAASAGLLRFFEEETKGIQMRPEIIVIFAVGLIVLCVLAQVYFFTGV
jgi:preprotein translocase subunit Sec61beta